MARDAKRERRITYEIIVDAYGPEEQALGWYYYLQNHLNFPFSAKCVTEKKMSPLIKGEQVNVTDMAPEEDCMNQMMVIIEWSGRTMGVPLLQLKAIDADKERNEAIADWNYWVKQGYQLC